MIVVHDHYPCPCLAASWFATLLALSTLSLYAAPFRFPPAADGSLGAIDTTTTRVIFISAPCAFLLVTCCFCCIICCCCSSTKDGDTNLEFKSGRESKVVQLLARISKRLPQDSRVSRFSKSFTNRVSNFEIALARGSGRMGDSGRRTPERLSARSGKVQDGVATSRNAIKRFPAAKYSVRETTAPSRAPDQISPVRKMSIDGEPDELSPVRRMSVDDVRRIATA